jgi:hypothetical protein
MRMSAAMLLFGTVVLASKPRNKDGGSRGFASELLEDYWREAKHPLRHATAQCLLTGANAGGGGGAHLRHEASLPQVPCRFDFAKFAAKYFNCTGNAAEIGVYRGNFSAHNLMFWKGAYYAIDYWNYRPWDAPHGSHSANDKNFKKQADNDDNYETAKQAMAYAGDRSSEAISRPLLRLDIH